MLKKSNPTKFFFVFLILGVAIFIAFAIGTASGYLIYKSTTPPTITEKKVVYPYLSQRILHENPNDIIISFQGLRKELNEYILSDKKRVAVYFEYLPTGTSIGVNENVSLTGASLFKLPFVMHTYKLIEANKINPNTKIKITEEDLDDNWGSLAYTALGQEYRVKELIYETIVNSDNTAFNALFYSVNQEVPNELFEELDLTFPKEDEHRLISTKITPRAYAKILKSLFFSTYLSFESSNEILNLMTNIKDGMLRSNIPKDIEVAHKIGINIAGLDHQKHMISDCGIIYVPERPYILCIMVQDDQINAKRYIQTISDMIYSYISNN